MKLQKVESDLGLKMGDRLPFDFYDQHGTMILKKGHIILDSKEISNLILGGIYYDVEYQSFIPKLKKDKNEKQEKGYNPFEQYQELQKKLSPLMFEIFKGIADRSTVQVELYGICELLNKWLDQDPDATLACIILEKGESYSIKHPMDSAIICLFIGRQYNLEQDDLMYLAMSALTMNISLLDIQDKLHLQTQKLSDLQRYRIHNHPTKSRELLENVGVTDPRWLNAVSQHHEALDGSGYPNKIKGDLINQFSQIIAVADLYCAMVTDKGYRSAVSANRALREVFSNRGKSLNTIIATLLIKELGVYPPGTVVELESSEVGIVVRRGQNANKPVVMSILDFHGMPMMPLKRDITEKYYKIRRIINPRKENIKVNKDLLWGYFQFQGTFVEA